MSFAVRKDGTAWRAVASQADVDPATENWQATQPAPIGMSIRNDAYAVLNRKTMERIQRAVVAGRTTWAAADVVAYCAFLDKVQAIATGKDATSTALPVEPPYPAGT